MKTVVQTFFENYAAALLSFSAEKISEFYQTPLTVYSDQDTIVVKEIPEVINFWRNAVIPYQKINIVKAVPTVLAEEQLSEKIYTAKVLWKNYDPTETKVSNEINFYIMSMTKDKMKISGLILMTKLI